MIRQYLSNVINDHKEEWKIQLTMKINFVSSKDSKETHAMYTKSGNIEIMIGTKTDETIERLFESLLERYEKILEEKMKGSEFVYDSVEILR